MSDLALQLRMQKLLKEGFKAIDIARQILFYETLPTILPKNEEYVAILKDGKVTSFLEVSTGVQSEFTDENCLTQNSSLVDAILKLITEKVIFIKTLGGVVAYVTKNDLQKPPVRMWLFGTLTIIETFYTRAIAGFFPDDSWVDLVSASRLKKAKEIQAERIRRGALPPSLLDCLQYGDKLGIVSRSDEMRAYYKVDGTKTYMRNLVKQTEVLRNSLAHSQPIEDLEIVFIAAQRIDISLTRI
jgi:hypothetical protein